MPYTSGWVLPFTACAAGYEVRFEPCYNRYFARFIQASNMTAKCSLGLILLVSAACAADAVPPLDIKPGMWESTTTVKMSGTPPIPPDLLAKMPPEQRAMLEARLKERQGPNTTVSKHCIAKDDLNKPLDFGGQQASCQRTVASSSSSKMEIRIECSNAGIKSSGTIRIEAVDSEHVKVSSHIASGEGARAMNIDVAGAGKWLGAACTASAEK
jgi:hypothetical protein